MQGSLSCSGRDGPHEAPHLSLQSPGVLREFRVVRRRDPFPHAPELISKGLQCLLLIPPTALQPKGFILDQAVRALITHVELDWRAQTKNRIAMNDTYHSLSSICREGREVLRPPSHHPSFYRTVHSHAKPLTPHPTFAGMNSAGFFFAMSTTCAYLAVMRGSAWPRKSRTARRPPVCKQTKVPAVRRRAWLELAPRLNSRFAQITVNLRADMPATSNACHTVISWRQQRCSGSAVDLAAEGQAFFGRLTNVRSKVGDPVAVCCTSGDDDPEK